MKIAFAAVTLIVLSILVSSAPSQRQLMDINVAAPEGLTVSGVLYNDGTWSGGGLRQVDKANSVQMKIFDLSYFPEFGYVHVCVGKTDQDSSCADYAVQEGKSVQTTDWIGGPADFTIEQHLTP